MKTITFKKEINAPIQKVWDALWDKDNYSEWTKHFAPSSKYESDWKVGGKTLFLGPNNDGLISTITKLDVPKEVIFNHLADIVNGVEGNSFGISGFEKYELKEIDGVTTLVISLDISEEYEQDMSEGFTKGLEEVKRIAEKK